MGAVLLGGLKQTAYVPRETENRCSDPNCKNTSYIVGDDDKAACDLCGETWVFGMYDTRWMIPLRDLEYTKPTFSENMEKMDFCVGKHTSGEKTMCGAHTGSDAECTACCETFWCGPAKLCGKCLGKAAK